MNEHNTEDRRITLLRACRDLLQKQENSVIVLNLLKEKVRYDGEDCDGYCLLDELNTALEIEDYFD